MMFCWCVLPLLTLVTVVMSNNAAIKVKLTQKGLDNTVVTAIEQMLTNVDLLEQSKTEGWVKYHATGLKIHLLKSVDSVQNFVPTTGLSATIRAVNLYMTGNWGATLFNLGKENGPFEFAVPKLTLTVSVEFKSDRSGQPALSMEKCDAKTEGSRLNADGFPVPNFFIEQRICPLLENPIKNWDAQLRKLKANVTEYAEIDLSVGSVVVSSTSMELGLKGVFYSTGQHGEPPFTPTAFPLPSGDAKMFYIGISAFTINSAMLVHHNADVFNIKITDDMISKTYPNMKMMLTVKTEKAPVVEFKSNNAILQAFSTVTAFAIQPDNTLTKLFVLDLVSSLSMQASVTENKLVLALTVNEIKASKQESKVGDFEVTKLNSVLNTIMKDVAFPVITFHLPKGFPLPGLPISFFKGKIKFENTEIGIFKDYLLIGTDVQFQKNEEQG